MTSDIDIYRSANVLIRLHGEDAPLETAQRHQCPLWVTSGHPAPHSITSAFGGKADIQCPLLESYQFWRDPNVRLRG